MLNYTEFRSRKLQVGWIYSIYCNVFKTETVSGMEKLISPYFVTPLAVSCCKVPKKDVSIKYGQATN
jgi:hypothetical protein